MESGSGSGICVYLLSKNTSTVATVRRSRDGKLEDSRQWRPEGGGVSTLTHCPGKVPARPPPQRSRLQCKWNPGCFSSSLLLQLRKTRIRAKRVKRQALPPLKAENTRITVGVQQPWCCCCSGTDDGPDGGDLHGDDGLPRADGPLHPHLVPHLPGEEGGDEARQPVQGQLRVQDGQIQFQDSKLVGGLRRKSSNDG